MAENQLSLIPEKSEKTLNILPIIIVIIALFALSSTAIFIKIAIREMSAVTTFFNRLWIATIIFGLWSGINQARTEITDDEAVLPQQPYAIKEIAFLIAVALVHVLGRLSWTWSLTQTGAANANALGSLNPLFTTLGGWLFFNQIFGRKFIIGLILAIIGAIAVGFEDLLHSNNNITGDAVALISSIFYAANFLLIEQIRNKFSVITILLWRCVIATSLMIPVVLIFEKQVFPVTLSGWLVVFALAAICEALGHGLIIYSLKNFSSGFISLFLLLNPLIVAILAWILFSEKLSIFNLLGLALILAGIYLAISNKESVQSKVNTHIQSPAESES
ncbi:DMT family transporter [Nostoc sp. 'Lobaria pulmonaria (5183) cyanobiont']|uniref:DMT family transporter n=1 Tax=Nostoc sp. 'Lobaria pulmonaria (5183) cyanobiont' TaxID=1618022 RepID=UPI000CF33EFA|nr:DMT family transporter [Nostoc sp. 'Lobaria pulmonaria (5183) cyanobiont']AVH71431.1 drug/metabolite transporter (DMT) superfamily permease [Nostoc sp. 'Lobaria pulmonaria (5183) cyanobiont']